MPRGFWFPDPSIRIWRAQHIDPQRMNGSYALVGRVAPGGDVRHMDASMRHMAATLAQRFYFQSQRVALDNVTPTRTDKTSDFLAAVSGRIARNTLAFSVWMAA